MTKENYKIDIDGMYYLVVAVYTDYKIRGENNPYEQLMSQVETYKMNHTPFDPSIHKIDDFMVDAYRIYDRYVSIEDKLSDKIEDMLGSTFLNMFGIDKDKIKEEFEKYKTTFNDIIDNCDFEDPQIRGIQKNILIEKMNKAADKENYELAAKFRDKIKKI